MKMVLEVGSGSSLDITDITPKDYKIRFMPVCALADVFLDLVPPDREVVDKIYGDFIKADVQFLPFKGEAFDEIYARHLIEHVNNYILFLQECYRVLKPAGKLFLYTPNYFSKYATSKRPLSKKTDPSHIHIFTNMRLTFFLKKLGFKTIALKSLLATYYPIPTYLRWVLNFFFSEEIRIVATK